MVDARAAEAPILRDVTADRATALETLYRTHARRIERAIAESRSATEAEPGSAVARRRLRAGLRNKVALLRTAAIIDTTVRKP